MAEAEEEGKKKGGKLVLILLIVVILLVLALGAVGAMMFLGGDEEAGEETQTEQVDEEQAQPEQAPATNFNLDGPITVNFANPTDARLLQMDMQFRTHLENGEEIFRNHQGEIVNNINLVAGEFDPATLRTREGKEALREAIVTEVNQVIENREGISDAVDDVFLTRLLMQ